MTLTPIQQFVFDYWPVVSVVVPTAFTGLFGVAWYFWKLHDSTNPKKEQAAFEFRIKSLEKELLNSENEKSGLKSENSDLRKTIKEKYSNEAILAQYERDQESGVATHKKTKQIYCNSCLNENPPQEKMMAKMGSGKHWTCAVPGHPNPSVKGSQDDSWRYDEAIKKIPKNYGMGF